MAVCEFYYLVIQLFYIDKTCASKDFFPIQYQQDSRPGIDKELSSYEWFFCDVGIERLQLGMVISHQPYLIEHDITDTAIGSLDVKEAETVFGYCLLYGIDICQMFHLLLSAKFYGSACWSANRPMREERRYR